jgi:ribosomal-protein-alanine N-acetyltransferase
LRLRAPVEADIDAIFEYGSDPNVSFLMDWRCLSHRREAQDFLSRSLDSWQSGTEFTWVVAELGPDVVIGATSLRVRDTEADFGYVLNQRYWARGFATEAAAAVVSWVISVRGIPRIWATCDAENHRSMRVLEKLGLRREGLVSGGTIRPNISQQARSSYLYGKVNNAV